MQFQIRKPFARFARFLENAKVLVTSSKSGELFDDLRLAWYMSDERFPEYFQEMIDAVTIACGTVAKSMTIMARNARLAADNLMVALMTVAQITEAQRKKIESAATSRKPWPPPGVVTKE